jgi:hypothetical protein
MLCVLRGLGDYQSLSIELSEGTSRIDVELVIDTVAAVICNLTTHDRTPPPFY